MIQSTFDDFDAFADTVRDADMEMLMCNRKRSTWDLLFMSIDGVHLQVGDLGSGNLVRGLGEKDRYVVYTPLSGDFDSVLNGATVRKGHFAAVSVSEALVRTFLPVLGSPSIRPAATGGRKILPRQEIIDRAVAVAEAESVDPPSVRKLADAAGVSERSLRNVFSEYMGMGPVRYLQLRQFRKIHRELAAAGPDETTVTDVLVANGVWQWGRFAARYRQVFGEMPSETLRKSRSPASRPSVIAATRP